MEECAGPDSRTFVGTLSNLSIPELGILVNSKFETNQNLTFDDECDLNIQNNATPNLRRAREDDDDQFMEECPSQKKEVN